MIKNLVTISLIIFIVIIISVLGAGVFINQNNTNQPTTIISNNNTTPKTNIGDEDNDPNDEEGEDGSKNTNTPVVNIPTNNQTSSNNFTASQIAQHNKFSDCWMIINSKVYNLTSYMSAHPGGTGTIIPLCGKDGTNAFDTKGGQGSHSQNANNLLNNYYIGNFVR